MKKALGLALLIVVTAAATAQAGIYQGNYTSAQTCGPGHFEFGAYGTFFPEKVFGQAGGFVGGKLTVGVLDWLDVGGSYAIVPTQFLPSVPRNYNAYTWGGEVKVRILNEDLVAPTITAFADYYSVNIAANISGIVGKVKIDDFGFGLVVSKSFGPIEPFGTIGYRFGSTSVDAVGVHTGDINLQNTIPFSGGCEIDLGPFQLVGEVLFIKDVQIYGGGLNIYF